MAFPLAIEALNILLLSLLVSFGGGSKSFILHLILLAEDMFFILARGCADDGSKGDVDVG